MHHLLLMHEGDGRHELLEDGARLSLGEAVPHLEPVQQLSSPHQLHHHVDVELVCVDLVESNDVGVALAHSEDGHLTTWVVPGSSKSLALL